MAGSDKDPQKLSNVFNAVSGIEYLDELQEVYETSGLAQEEETLALLTATRAQLQDNPNQISLSICKASIDYINKAMTKELELHKALEEEQARSRTDSLTNIANREQFNEDLQVAIDKVGTDVEIPDKPVTRDKIQTDDGEKENERVTAEEGSKHYSALLFLDLDRFKGLNDTFGHKAGDEGLKFFADLISKITRDGDQSAYTSDTHQRARLGGDEFAIILNIEAKDPEEAQKKFELALNRILKALAVQGITLDKKDLKNSEELPEKVTLPIVSSVGKYVIQEGDDLETVMKKADAALYAHKEERDEHGKEVKPQRYENSEKGLIAQGRPNVQTVADKRADEARLERILKAGTALIEIKDNGEASLITTSKNTPDAVKSLQEEGVHVHYGTPTSHTPAPEL